MFGVRGVVRGPVFEGLGQDLAHAVGAAEGEDGGDVHIVEGDDEFVGCEALLGGRHGFAVGLRLLVETGCLKVNLLDRWIDGSRRKFLIDPVNF